MRRYAWTGRATMRLVVFLGLVCTIIMLLISGCGDDDDNSSTIVDNPYTDNHAPIANYPFTTTTSFSDGARVDYDLRYREHGCSSSGTPTSVSGAWDSDGDPLEYKVDCEWSVYAVADGETNAREITGEWVKFPREDGEQHALVTLFVGHTGDDPPYPFAPKSCLPANPGDAEDEASCGDSVGPWSFTYTVRDGKGGQADCAVTFGE